MMFMKKGYDVATGKCIIEVDPRYFRPTEVDSLFGDASKAREKLGWVPKTSFLSLVSEMMEEDMRQAQCDDLIRKNGFKVSNRKE